MLRQSLLVLLFAFPLWGDSEFFEVLTPEEVFHQGLPVKKPRFEKRELPECANVKLDLPKKTAPIFKATHALQKDNNQNPSGMSFSFEQDLRSCRVGFQLPEGEWVPTLSAQYADPRARFSVGYDPEKNRMTLTEGRVNVMELMLDERASARGQERWVGVKDNKYSVELIRPLGESRHWKISVEATHGLDHHDQGLFFGIKR